MKLSTFFKILGGLGLAGGSVALIASDNEKVVHFRENLGKFTGVMFGSAARAMQGNDISYTRDTGWEIKPHRDLTPSQVRTSSADTSIPSDWRFMSLADQNQYLEAVKLRQKHEERMKELEVEKAKAEAAAANVVVTTVEEKKEEKKDE